ncbi:MAG: hypothetical protein KDE05_07985, partial [Parvularculaceae bacterium]|nr:hypothetical protein [Parvularculaceae bacterium]
RRSSDLNASHSAKYEWWRIGESEFFTECDAFLYTTQGNAPKPNPEFIGTFRSLKRVPKLPYFRSQSDVHGIIEDIREHTRNAFSIR